MQIVFYCPHYKPTHNKGDTAYLHNIVTYLQTYYDVIVMVKNITKAYSYENVKVIPRCTSLFNKVDLIICQLDVLREVVCIAPKIPTLWIMHNTFKHVTIEENPQIGVIYNSQAAKEVKPLPNDSFVLTPPISYDHYEGGRGEYITLINCNENKGGKIVHEIASKMPFHKFLQVKGSYGTQYVSTDDEQPVINMDNHAITYGLGKLPNVTVIENQTDIRGVYAMTRILLMPSDYESWGMTATEAMCSGIPVICTPTFGLKENLGNSGIFVDRNDINQWILEIKKLDGKKEYTAASDAARKRAKELDSKPKLEKFKHWIEKFINKHNGI